MNLRDNKETLFTDADLSHSQFTDVNLQGAQFADVNLSQTAFTDINLTGATFHDVNLSHVEITDGCLAGMKINGVLVSQFSRYYQRPSDQPPGLPPQIYMLVKACETVCVAECCGLAAFDFSPIYMASCLLHAYGQITDPTVQEIRTTIQLWRKTHGTPSGKGYNSEEMGENLSAAQVDAFCDMLERNVMVAVGLIHSIEAQGHPRYF